MAKGRYTELFFLDEATAFASGHRPCAECRRERYNEFKTKWLEANKDLLGNEKDSIGNIDKIIHIERISKNQKVTFNEHLNNLPSGTMIELNDKIFLIWENSLYEWSFRGYNMSNIVISTISVKVLTPFSYVEMFKKGFIPNVDESVNKSR